MKRNFILVTLLVSPLLLNAQTLYKYVDENGVTHFSNRPINEKAKTVEVKKLNTFGDKPKPSLKALERLPEKKKVKVVMYGANECAKCEPARNYFASRHIQILEHNIDHEMRARLVYNRLKGQSVPLFLVDGELVRGFSPDKMDLILEEKNI